MAVPTSVAAYPMTTIEPYLAVARTVFKNYGLP